MPISHIRAVRQYRRANWLYPPPRVIFLIQERKNYIQKRTARPRCGIFILRSRPRQASTKPTTWRAWRISLCKIPLKLKKHFRKSVDLSQKKYADADIALGSLLLQ